MEEDEEREAWCGVEERGARDWRPAEAKEEDRRAVALALRVADVGGSRICSSLISVLDETTSLDPRKCSPHDRLPTTRRPPIDPGISPPTASHQIVPSSTLRLTLTAP